MSIRIKRRRGPSVACRWCPKCGARNDANARFCRICATPLEVKMVFDDGETNVGKCCDKCGRSCNYRKMKLYWGDKAYSTVCVRCYRRLTRHSR